MVVVRFTPKFKKIFSKQDAKKREKVLKQIAKLKAHPEARNPLRNMRKGTRELHIHPFRLSYSYEKEIITLLDFYHKDER